MNSADKKALHAFLSMFAVLSHDIKRKFEERANGKPLPHVTIARAATSAENADTPLKTDRPYLKFVANPAPGESFVQFCGADTFPNGGIDTSSA